MVNSGGAIETGYIYEAFDRRMEKTIDGATTEFLYDGLNPVQELNGATPPTATADLLTGLNIDEYFTRTGSSGAMVFLADALGSTIGVVKLGGSIDINYTYEPFGNTTVSGSNSNPYHFTRSENDGTGLYYYRARYYSPTFQRFVSQDPLDFKGGDSNLYAYVRNQPTNLTDPTGGQDVILPPEGTVMPPPGTDLDPLGPEQGPPLCFSSTFRQCMNAAEDSSDWLSFCDLHYSGSLWHMPGQHIRAY